MNAMSQSLASIQDAIANASGRAGKPPARLLAVAKTQPVEAVTALASLGQRAFGENYVQEALIKARALAHLGLEWHLIGHLQSNKCQEVAETFDWLQSLDRIKLIEPLNRFRPTSKGRLNVLVQVNVDGEASKSGCAPEHALTLARAVATAPNLHLRGLMGIGAPFDDPALRRASFKRLHALYKQIQAEFPDIDTLSMGMSDDFELAIEEGATMVRVGSRLFGARL